MIESNVFRFLSDSQLLLEGSIRDRPTLLDGSIRNGLAPDWQVLLGGRLGQDGLHCRIGIRVSAWVGGRRGKKRSVGGKVGGCVAAEEANGANKQN